MNRDGEVPTIGVSDTILVKIRRSQPEAPSRVFRDDGTVAAFMEWSIDHQVYPVSGGSVGPGFYEGVFAAKDAEAIRGWIKRRKAR